MNVQDHLQPGEEILYEARPSRIPLAPPLTLAAVLAIVALVAWRQVPPPGGAWLAAVCGVGAAAALVQALIRWVRLAANAYVLTDRRILRLSGLLGRSSMDSYLDKVNNVEHHQTLWGRLLGYGDVEIDTAAGTGAEVFRRISHPLAWKRAVDAAVAAYHAGVRTPVGAVPATAAPAAPANATPANSAPSGADKLRQLKKLLDDGLISEAEFQAKRQQILDQL